MFLGQVDFLARQINLLFSLAQWASAWGCCWPTKKKKHTHTKVYPGQAKFKSYIWTCPKGKLEFKVFFQSWYIHFHVYGHKPVNIEITATFPELGCHFHSVLRRQKKVIVDLGIANAVRGDLLIKIHIVM